MAQGETGTPAARTDDADDAEPVTERRGGFGSLGSILYLLVLTWIAGIATFPLNDNSFFTHLATGRIILDEGRVPSTDPYTFTAQGEPWTVQSWLASVAYAGFERLGGDVGLRLLTLLVFGAAITVLWQLSRPARSVIVRFLIVAGALFVVTDLWSERPYMIGVVGLGLVWLALEGRFRAWWLVPFLWVWVNTHGSFLLAIALVAAVVLGGVLDRRAAGDPSPLPDTERSVIRAVVLGTLLGAIGPIGPKLLLFPFTAMAKSGTFAEIIEWRPPAYQSTAERAFLVLVVVVLLLLVRRGSWRLALPGVAFAAAAVFAQRNVVMAAVILVAVGAQCAPELGTLRADDRPGLGRPVAVLLSGVLLAVATLALLLPVDGFGGYPTRALAWLSAADRDGVRTGTQILTGNLLEVLDGPTGEVFMDDRVDMVPEDVFEDYLVLRDGSTGWQQVLDRYAIETVVWERGTAIASLLAVSDEWAIVYSDVGWVVAERR